ncbi:MAG TPA: putative quinol monooxygenase [Xanthobacteraceae bacterium]|jgi:quinol monooxygenase YgiN|nr:putative quinol monooxygenase [Xanthobacteraceae bacterium]
MTTTTDLDDVSVIVGAFETQLGSRTIPFAMIARFQVKEDAQARVEQAFEKAVPPTLREAGVLAYQPHRDPATTAGFVVYERWKSLDDLEAHLRTSYIADLRQEIDAVMTGAPEFILLRPL